MTKWNKSAYAITAAAILAAAASLAAYAAAEPPQPGFPAGQEYTTSWRYVGSPEEGARFYHDEWFQVLPDGSPDDAAYQDAAQRRYYSENGTLCKSKLKTINEDTYYFESDGNICRNRFRTIQSKRYLFGKDGRMQTGLKLILHSPGDYENIIDIIDPKLYDTVEKFIDQYNSLVAMSRKNGGTPHVASYYFGSDGVIRTGKTNGVILDDDAFDFQFAKSGSGKGQGITGLDDKRVHLGGLVMKANKDDKYEVVIFFKDGTVRQYTLIDLLNTLGLLELQAPNTYGKVDVSFSNGSFKELIESTIGAVEEYYVCNTVGSCRDRGTFKDGSDIYVVTEQWEIVRIYQE